MKTRPVRVNASGNVDITYDELVALIDEAYEEGYADASSKLNINPVQNPVQPTIPSPYNPMYPYVTWDFSKGPNDVPDANWAKGAYTISSSTLKDYITPNGCLSFDECIDFLKNRQKK